MNYCYMGGIRVSGYPVWFWCAPLSRACDYFRDSCEWGVGFSLEDVVDTLSSSFWIWIYVHRSIDLPEMIYWWIGFYSLLQNAIMYLMDKRYVLYDWPSGSMFFDGVIMCYTLGTFDSPWSRRSKACYIPFLKICKWSEYSCFAVSYFGCNTCRASTWNRIRSR